jgi:hypothetical protein
LGLIAFGKGSGSHRRTPPNRNGFQAAHLSNGAHVSSGLFAVSNEGQAVSVGPR